MAKRNQRRPRNAKTHIRAAHVPSQTPHKRSARLNSRSALTVAPLSARSYEARNRALHALAAIRHGASLAEASRSENVSQQTIFKYVGSALLQDRPGGRIRATKSDRLVRYLQIPDEDGPIEKKVRGSTLASDSARYLSAVNRFLGGERHALAEWHGKKIAGIDLITAGRTLKDLADKGLLPLSLYRSLSGAA